MLVYPTLFMNYLCSHQMYTQSDKSQEFWVGLAINVKCDAFNRFAPEPDIYSLAHHLCKMWIFYEPRSVTLGNTWHFVEEYTRVVTESLKKYN